MRFTREEFTEMVNEILYSKPARYDTLCRIADKTLKPTVINWCRAEDCLRGRGCEEDIMQKIHLRLMQKIVNFFLLRDGIDGPYNDDPEGFEDWMFRVAGNLKRDHANEIRFHDFKTENLDDLPEPAAASDDTHKDEMAERLQMAFDIAFRSNFSVYKKLTWLAQSVFILNTGVRKIESNDALEAAFADKTLLEMYGMILQAAKRIPWLRITREQNEKIIEALRKKRADGVTYGETKYRDFFMKQNGKASGKKSISDWVNRMNGLIKRESEPEDDTPKKKSEGKDPKKKGSGEDEAPDA